MNLLKKFLFIAIVGLLTITSCQKEKLVDKTDDKQPEPIEYSSNSLTARMSVEANNEEGIDLGCFTINFTFNLLVNGVEKAIASVEDFDAVIGEISSDSTASIDFVYPFDITSGDGVVKTIENEGQIAEEFANCIPDDWENEDWENDFFPAYVISLDNSCYEMVYPVSLSDGTDSYTVNNVDELINLLASGEVYSYEYPLSLIGDAGIVVEVNDADGLFAVLAGCDFQGEPTDSFYLEGIGQLFCFDIVFPMSYINVDGETVVADDLGAFTSAVLSGEMIGFAYPLTLSNGDLDDIVVENENELAAAIETCETEPIGFSDEGLDLLFFGTLHINVPDSTFEACYTINYPITVVYTDGGTNVIEDAEGCEAELSNDLESVLQFPVTVIKLEGGKEVVLESFEDLFQLVSDCQ